MATSPCNINCENEEMVQVVLECQDELNLLELKVDRPGLIKCEQILESLTDDAEWDALKVAGHIITLPPLIDFEIPEPELLKVKVKECANTDTVIGKTQRLPISTILIDVATKTDEELVRDFRKKIGGYTFILGLCSNQIMYNGAWATGENPGFGGLIGDLNYVSKTVGSKKYLAITGYVEFDLTTQNWARLTVTTAVYNAIFN